VGLGPSVEPSRGFWNSFSRCLTADLCGGPVTSSSKAQRRLNSSGRPVRASSQATCSPDSWPELGNGGGSPARGPRRREHLASKAWVLLSAPRRRARSDLFGSLALAPGKSDPPQRVEPQEGRPSKQIVSSRPIRRRLAEKSWRARSSSPSSPERECPNEAGYGGSRFQVEPGRQEHAETVSKDGAHRIGWRLAPGSGDALKLLKSFGAQPALSGGECQGSDRTCPT
jgi:hypothetical protein